MYLVTEGELEVVTVTATADPGPLYRVKAGSVVGDQPFFDESPRSAKVWADSRAGYVVSASRSSRHTRVHTRTTSSNCCSGSARCSRYGCGRHHGRRLSRALFSEHLNKARTSAPRRDKS